MAVSRHLAVVLRGGVVCIYIYIYIYMCVCVCVCMYVYVRMYMYVACVDVYIYIYIYTHTPVQRDMKHVYVCFLPLDQVRRRVSPRANIV